MRSPFDKAAKLSRPRSMPTALSLAGKGVGVYSTAKQAYQAPQTRLTVRALIEESFGSGRLRRTLTLPILHRDRILPCNLNPVLLNANELNRFLFWKCGNHGFSALRECLKKVWSVRSCLNSVLCQVCN